MLGAGVLVPGRETAPAPSGLSPTRGNPSSAAAKSMVEGRSLCACEEEGVETLKECSSLAVTWKRDLQAFKPSLLPLEVSIVLLK